MAGLLADECFSGPPYRGLVAAGYDVRRSADTLAAASDEDILAFAFASNRILLTEDADFGELTVRLGRPTHGVIRLHLKAMPRDARLARLLEALEHLADGVRNALVTIEPTRTRVRTLARPQYRAPE
jgi:predicted nuclease of predicted toxin-antitoxin system